jgi:hypothetical protein
MVNLKVQMQARQHLFRMYKRCALIGPDRSTEFVSPVEGMFIIYLDHNLPYLLKEARHHHAPTT